MQHVPEEVWLILFLCWRSFELNWHTSPAIQTCHLRHGRRGMVPNGRQWAWLSPQRHNVVANRPGSGHLPLLSQVSQARRDAEQA